MTLLNHEHPFAQYVRILGKGKHGSRALTEIEAYEAMSMIMTGQVKDVQLGAFLMLMRIKEETAEELLGFIRAVKNNLHLPAISVDLDWSSYAGKRRHLPWYLLVIKLLAQQGIRIFIHGASGHTVNRLYTEEVMQALGFPVAQNVAELQALLDQHHFAYYSLAHWCPTLYRIIELRNILGLRSPVHTLSRLLNPLNAPAVLQSIFHPSYAPVHQQAAYALGYQHVAVIRGEGGEIELNPERDTRIYWVTEQQLAETLWPTSVHQREPQVTLDIQQLKSVWRGEETCYYGEQAVIQTLALALQLLRCAESREKATVLAKNLWQQRDKAQL